MSCCVPACGVPSCGVPTCIPAGSSPVCYPVGGLGSLSSCGAGAYGGIYGGGSVSAASLGIAPGASVSCVNQTPPSEVMIQPSPINVVVPGAVLVATGEPVRVGGYTACASGGASAGGSSRLRYYPCGPCGPCK